MLEGIKFAGFALAWISLGCTITTIAMPDWRVNDVEGEVVELIKRTQGLWVKCAFFPTGNWQCEDYDRFFIALPAAITGARVFSGISLVLQVISIIAIPFGMMCTAIPESPDEASRYKTKATITIACGAMSILAAICIGTAVSWYAALVVEDYSRYTTGMSAGIETSVQRFIYGRALYYGWAAMSFLLIQGVLLCCSSWGDHAAETGYGQGQQYPGDQQMGYDAQPYSPYASQAKYQTGGPEYI